MSKRKYVGAAVGAIALLVAGGLFASNMGFKLNYVLEGPDGGATSLSGTQSLGLPYNQQTSLVNASDVRTDVGANFSSLSKFLKTNDGLQGYTGGAFIDCNPATLGNCDFALTPGEGYRLQVSADQQYIIVGSHDPGLVVNLDTTGTNGSQSGTNDFSYAYHQTAALASELKAEIDAQGGAGAVLSISKFLRTTDGIQGYTGGAFIDCNPATLANCDFALTPGESYRIQVGTNVAYTPSHY